MTALSHVHVRFYSPVIAWGCPFVHVVGGCEQPISRIAAHRFIHGTSKLQFLEGSRCIEHYKSLAHRNPVSSPSPSWVTPDHCPALAGQLFIQQQPRGPRRSNVLSLCTAGLSEVTDAIVL